MSLEPGTRLGPYEITAAIGEGGMGEVYRARDTRLNRTVALKVIKGEFTGRFEREARAISSLNHPGICALYDVGSTNGSPYLVMEFVEGRPIQGPLGIEEALDVGARIAAALDAAHRNGIVHRDLKPPNILRTKDGVKLLDFGIALQREPMPRPAPTASVTLTLEGTLVGTLNYMAPEQLEGKDADARSDIFAFGCVLFEMLTGRRAFDGSSHASIIASRWQRQPVTPVAPARFQIYPPASHEFSASLATTPAPEMALSPDGRNLVFSAISAAGDSALWLRALDRTAPRALQDTQDASYPFWSPDSRSIAFFAQGKLKRIAIETGSVREICGECDGYGGSWNEQDTILAALGSGSIFRIPASGGKPAALIEGSRGAGEGVYRFPSFFPDGRRFLAIRRSTNPELRGLYAASVDDPGLRQRVLASSHAAVVAAPGWLVYLDGQSLIARHFDDARLEMLGDPQPLADRVGGATTSYASISASKNGTLAFAGAMRFNANPTWFNREGKMLSAIEPAGDYADFRISPGGDGVAMSRFDPGAGAHDIWLFDIARGAPSRFTVDAGLDASPIWSPDGNSIVFRSNRTGLVSLYRALVLDPTRRETILDSRGTSMPGNLGSFNGVPCSLTPDGKTLIYTVGTKAFDIWFVEVEGERKPRSYQTAPFNKIHAALSPDGKWLAYASDETGRYEVHVGSFPEAGPKVSVSTGGGWEPRWRDDGRELYFLAPERKLMAVTVGPGSPPKFGVPRPMFSTRTRLTPHPYRRNFDVAPGGQRFLVNTLAEDAPRPAIEVVLNWQAALPR